MKINFIPFVLGVVLIAITGCNGSDQKDKQKSGSMAHVEAVYTANLRPLNSNVTGMEASGAARFIVTNDSIFVTIDVAGVPGDMQHWQHFHGFKNDSIAVCTTEAADANGDGIIDVVETEPVSGTTMVPFNARPEEMQVGSDTYPKAGSDGTYQYEVRIPLQQLKTAFAKSFGDSSLDLSRRVLYIHGVPSNTTLPATVASIGDIPAQVTIPIACGKIEKVMN